MRLTTPCQSPLLGGCASKEGRAKIAAWQNRAARYTKAAAHRRESRFLCSTNTAWLFLSDGRALFLSDGGCAGRPFTAYSGFLNVSFSPPINGYDGAHIHYQFQTSQGTPPGDTHFWKRCGSRAPFGVHAPRAGPCLENVRQLEFRAVQWMRKCLRAARKKMTSNGPPPL